MWKFTIAPALAVACLLCAAPSAHGLDEADLIAVLTADDASLEEITTACRELQRVGTDEAAPVLAEMLTDERLSHPARTALEAIPGDAASEALRAALGDAEGAVLAGIVASIGARKDEDAVEDLAALLEHDDADVASAAARALGSIATDEAAEALKAALEDGPDAIRPAVREGLFRVAEAHLARGDHDEATEIYQLLWDTASN